MLIDASDPYDIEAYGKPIGDESAKFKQSIAKTYIYSDDVSAENITEANVNFILTVYVEVKHCKVFY